MRFELLQMNPHEMTAEVKKTIAGLVRGYEKIFNLAPGLNDIVYACKSEECGWWDDNINHVVAREIQVPKRDHNGNVDPSGMATAAALVCPECKFRVKAIAAHIWNRKVSDRRRRLKSTSSRLIVPGGIN